MAEDPDIDVIAAYAEGIREARSFLAALGAARGARKPVVLMKVGRSALGSAAAQSHTASIAGNDAVTDAVLGEFGVVRARSTEEMLDVAHVATRRVYPARNTLGVLTVCGGAGVLISDAAEELACRCREMPEDAQARLRELVPFAAPRNPVDCTAQVAQRNVPGRPLRRGAAQDGGYASVLAFFTQTGGAPQLRAEAARAARAMRAAPGPAVRALRRRFPGAGAGVRGGRLRSCSRTRPARWPRSTPWAGSARRSPGGRRRRRRPCRRLPCRTRRPARRRRSACCPPPACLRAGGTCASADEAGAAAEALGYPVVLKILSPDILHKSRSAACCWTWRRRRVRGASPRCWTRAAARAGCADRRRAGGEATEGRRRVPSA